jgi:hypothetical protein
MAEPRERQSRLDDARRTAHELIEALETSNVPIADCLMKAQRLARLLRDSDAQTWLTFEMAGYPKENAEQRIGWCRKYAYRFVDGKLSYLHSLPELEADVAAQQLVLTKMQAPTLSTPTANHLVAEATERVMTKMTAALVAHRDRFSTTAASFQRVKASIHQYAVDTLISLEFGDIAETLFEKARRRVDLFVRANCPKGAEQLVAVSERMRADDAESRAAALTSCRRLLNTIADAVYPPSDRPYVDGSGKPRDVGKEAYKNRLVAHVEQHLRGGSRRILASELSHLVDRLDALYEKTCKGVHEDVSAEEAELLIMQTYLFLGELAHLDGLPLQESPAASAPTAP